MQIKNFIENFVFKAKANINWLESVKELTGEEKKIKLDSYLIQWSIKTLDTIGLNFFLKWAIKTLFIKNIPTITQLIFDLIETRIQGITDDWIVDKNATEG